jgi:hypothetical protein
MHSFTANRSRITKRAAAVLVAMAVVAPAALASSTSTTTTSGVVHAYVDRSGTTVVSGYDGGAPLAPSRRR